MNGCETARTAGKPQRAWLGWTLLLGALAALVLLALTVGHRRQAEEMRHLLFANSMLPASQLSACLMQRLPLEGQWLPSPDKAGTVGAWNGQRDLMVEVIDGGAKGRRMEMSSRGGRAMTPAEAEALRTCLSGR